MRTAILRQTPATKQIGRTKVATWTVHSWLIRCRRQVALVCIGLPLATVSASGLAADIDRRVIDSLDPPWGSVGQINVSAYRRRVECTGSLVASNVVITAAHCVMDPLRHKPFDVDDIHFLAGVRRSSWLAHSTAKCLHFLPGYPDASQSFARDVVLITLTDDLKNVAPVETDRALEDADVSLVHAAYPADRRYVLTAQFGCHLLAHDQNLWLTDCDARPASSGGPVFVQTKDGLRLAAIMVGVGSSGSVAVPIGTELDFSAARDCR